MEIQTGIFESAKSAGPKDLSTLHNLIMSYMALRVRVPWKESLGYQGTKMKSFLGFEISQIDP